MASNEILFDSASKEVLKVMIFETWLRFYFIKQDGEELRIEIPEDVIEQIKKETPEHLGLAELMNNDTIDFEKSQATVCAHINAHLDGQKYETGMVMGVFDSKQFKIDHYLFTVWLKRHEQIFDEEMHSFPDWVESYYGWREMPEVQNYHKQLMETSPNAAPGTGSVQ
ncbi:MAG: hypothetical protein ACNI27_14650 [Desulfovibrio sp.]